MPNSTDKDELDGVSFIPVQLADDGELLLEFPEDLLDNMEWKEGDILVWTKLDNGNGYRVEKATTYE